MSHETQVFDLGFALARLEEGDDGSPLLTIVTPGNGDDPAQTITIGEGGVDGLIAIAHRLRYWNEKTAVAGGPSGPNYNSVLTPP